MKLMSQLYGDRAVIANATGCSSIYGGNLPTTPYTTRRRPRASWSNSLFEDAAEFGFGMRLTPDKMFEFGNELSMPSSPGNPVPAGAPEGDPHGGPIRAGRDRGTAASRHRHEGGTGHGILR